MCMTYLLTRKNHLSMVGRIIYNLIQLEKFGEIKVFINIRFAHKIEKEKIFNINQMNSTSISKV